jgi:hypothetical protein
MKRLVCELSFGPADAQIEQIIKAGGPFSISTEEKSIRKKTCKEDMF